MGSGLGILITGLLLDERARNGRIRFRAFWARRFRRLVPAMLTVVGAVAAWVFLFGPRSITPDVHNHGLAALTYTSNWNLIAEGTSYASLSAR